MKKLIAFILFICLLTSCAKHVAQSGSVSKSDYTTINAQVAKQMIDKNEFSFIIDVRTNSEYSASHIKNAILIPVDNIRTKIFGIVVDKNAKILVYCHSGVRSANASSQLVSLGYTNVYNLDGGIEAWSYGTVN